jgi:NAD(P)-dependent dehydrogenase (short-subunit alcohol dehydrogenase family)
VADEIKKGTDRLDILINNAGRGVMAYQLTDYGVDRHMAMNPDGSHYFDFSSAPVDEGYSGEG